MFRRRATSGLHRSSIRLTAFDAVLLAPVIALPLLVVVGLALFSMIALLILTGLAVAVTIVSDVVPRHWRLASAPVVVRHRVVGWPASARAHPAAFRWVDRRNPLRYCALHN